PRYVRSVPRTARESAWQEPARAIGSGRSSRPDRAQLVMVGSIQAGGQDEAPRPSGHPPGPRRPEPGRSLFRQGGLATVPIQTLSIRNATRQPSPANPTGTARIDSSRLVIRHRLPIEPAGPDQADPSGGRLPRSPSRPGAPAPRRPAEARAAPRR